MLKLENLLNYKIGIGRHNYCHLIELGSQKNIGSVNYSPKCFIELAHALVFNNVDANGNKIEPLSAITALMRHSEE